MPQIHWNTINGSLNSFFNQRNASSAEVNTFIHDVCRQHDMTKITIMIYF